METQEKIRIIKENFETLRARRIVKTPGDFALWCIHLLLIINNLWQNVRIRDFLMLILQKIRAWSHTPGSCQIFIQILCSGKNRGSVTKLAIILHPQNIDGSIHPQPVQP